MIRKLQVQNFKSIRYQLIELDKLNLLIGPNGAGKSNLISLFKFLERLSDQQLEDYIYRNGGINDFLFQGFETSDELLVQVELAEQVAATVANVYQFRIASDGEKYWFKHETFGFWNKSAFSEPYNTYQAERSPEASLKNAAQSGNRIADYIHDYLTDLKVFHFHDTSDNAQVKLPQPLDDVYYLRAEAENLAPFLLHLQENHFDTYLKIVETIRLVYPLFHDFALEESPRAKGKVQLRWKEKNTEQVFSARQISDGTLRFICLAALLIQPPDTGYVPKTIVLDEPELGLHPFAITVLAELIKKASIDKQLILATQSVSLINYFMPNDLLVVERDQEGASQFRRLKDEDFNAWLEDYSLGQLWESNFLGGRP